MFDFFELVIMGPISEFMEHAVLCLGLLRMLFALGCLCAQFLLITLMPTAFPILPVMWCRVSPYVLPVKPPPSQYLTQLLCS